MAIYRNTGLRDLLRGGDTFARTVQVVAANAVRVGFLGCVVAVFVYLGVVLMLMDGRDRGVLWINRVATIADVVGLGRIEKRFEYESRNGSQARTMSFGEWRRFTDSYYDKHIAFKSAVAVISALGAFAFVARIIVLRWRAAGEVLGRDQFIRGRDIVDAQSLDAMIDGPSPYCIGGVHIPWKALARNGLFGGAMGVGKSQSFYQLMDTARRERKRGIVYDRTGAFVERYFRPGIDILLNPFDTRSAAWSLFADIREHSDFSQLAYLLMPREKGDVNQVFTDAATNLLADLMEHCHSTGKSEHDLSRLAKKGTLEEIYAVLGDVADNSKFGGASRGQMNPEAVRMAESIRMSLIRAVRFLPVLPVAEKAEDRFSLRQWVESEDGSDSWLFIVNPAQREFIMKSFATAWLDIIINSVLSLKESADVRLFLFLDEVASLGEVAQLPAALTEARKYGLSTWIGLQSLAQLDKLYGEEAAKEIRDNLQTVLTMRVTSPETAEQFAKRLGEREIHEVHEAINLGVDAHNDGSGLHATTQERKLVLPTEIMALPDLEGFVSIAGAYPVAKVTIPIAPPMKSAERECLRQDLQIGKPPSATNQVREVESVDDEQADRFFDDLLGGGQQ
jgi:hypothetical protein